MHQSAWVNRFSTNSRPILQKRCSVYRRPKVSRSGLVFRPPACAARSTTIRLKCAPARFEHRQITPVASRAESRTAKRFIFAWRSNRRRRSLANKKLSARLANKPILPPAAVMIRASCRGRCRWSRRWPRLSCAITPSASARLLFRTNELATSSRRRLAALAARLCYLRACVGCVRSLARLAAWSAATSGALGGSDRRLFRRLFWRQISCPASRDVFQNAGRVIIDLRGCHLRADHLRGHQRDRFGSFSANESTRFLGCPIALWIDRRVARNVLRAVPSLADRRRRSIDRFGGRCPGARTSERFQCPSCGRCSSTFFGRSE